MIQCLKCRKKIPHFQAKYVCASVLCNECLEKFCEIFQKWIKEGELEDEL